jgi:hypothetical protein
MKRIVKLGIIIGAIAILMALVIGGTVMAAEPNPNASGSPGNGICIGAGDTDASCLAVTGQLTGLTVQEIQAERQTGKSLVQIASVHGISEDTLVKAILNARKATLQSAVTTGTITQSQADLMLQNMEQTIKQMVERTNVGPSGTNNGTNCLRTGCGMMSNGDNGGCGSSSGGMGPGMMNRRGAAK